MQSAILQKTELTLNLFEEAQEIKQKQNPPQRFSLTVSTR